MPLSASVIVRAFACGYRGFFYHDMHWKSYNCEFFGIKELHSNPDTHCIKIAVQLCQIASSCHCVLYSPRSIFAFPGDTTSSIPFCIVSQYAPHTFFGPAMVMSPTYPITHEKKVVEAQTLILTSKVSSVMLNGSTSLPK